MSKIKMKKNENWGIGEEESIIKQGKKKLRDKI